MRRLDWSRAEDRDWVAQRLAQRHSVEGGPSLAAQEILKAMRDPARRMPVLLELTGKFDRWPAEEKTIELPRSEWESFAAKVPSNVQAALHTAAVRIREFHEIQKSRLDMATWDFIEDGHTARLGQQVRALDRVGVYIPGGRAAYPSTVLMNTIPARVAGVREIIMVAPTPDGDINPVIVAAALEAGVDRLFRVGGAQAVAALAMGCGPIPAVDKIVGPGNAYVQAAKKQVFGEVDIDMIAGPSEVLVIADASANAAWVAADLLSQAEHDPLAAPILVSHDSGLLDAVVREIGAQLKTLPTGPTARESVEGYGMAILTRSLAESIEVANAIAPEHLELCIEKAESHVGEIRNAGAIFIGHYTPEAVGDYLAGPNHVLPTGGSARFFSPLGVYDFIKRTSLLHFGPADLRRLGHDVIALAEAEGFPAHANSIRVRLNSEKG